MSRATLHGSSGAAATTQYQCADEDLPPLEAEIVTRDGQRIQTKEDEWRFHAAKDGGYGLKIDFSEIEKYATRRFIKILQSYLAHVCRTYAPSTLKNIGECNLRVCKLLRKARSRKTDWSEITSSDFQTIITHGYKNMAGIGGNDFIVMRSMYAWALDMHELEGFTQDVYNDIKQIRARGNLEGHVARSTDPTVGAFTSSEMEMISDAVMRESCNFEATTLVHLYCELPVRHIQLNRTQKSDLKKYSTIVTEGNLKRPKTKYILSVPLGKQRNAGRELRQYNISNLLGERLELLFEKYPCEDERLLCWVKPRISPFEYSLEMKKWAVGNNLISGRTGEIVNMYGYRFRYTWAVMSLRAGNSEQATAEILGHADCQSIKNYVDKQSVVFDHISSNLDKAFGESIDYFLGNIESRNKLDESNGASRIVPGVFTQFTEMPIFDMGIGLCNKNTQKDGLCRKAPPISCYGCSKFVAFKEAPHGEIYESLRKFSKQGEDGLFDVRVSAELTITLQALLQLNLQLSEMNRAGNSE